MEGIVLSGSIITGIKAGITDSLEMINSTLNNQYLTELAVMFIGFAVVCGLVLYFLKGHRGTGSRYASDSYPGMSDAKRKEWNRLDDYGMRR